jgi:coatomer protein complex subunit alpha (xenin)
MFYVKDRYLRSYEFLSNRDVPIVSLARRSCHAYTAGVGSQGPHSVMYNQLNAADSNILVYLDEDGGSYELHSFSQDAGERGDAESGEAQRGPCMSCCFVARNKFATLDRSGKIHIKNYGNTSTKKLTSPLPNPTGIFFAGTAGRVLIRNEEKVMLYEHGSRRQINSIYFQRAKRVVWNRDFSFVAIMSKGSIVLATRNLEQLCTVTETVRIKSGAWDDRGVFIYTTLNHIKYVLPHSGDQGIVRSLDEVLYLTRVAGNVVHCLDREAQRRKVELDPTEYLFKLALFKKRYSDVMKMIKRSALPGQSIIAYLQRKGFPQVRLFFRAAATS